MCITVLICRPVLLSDGLWDQIRVDCGREFALILFIQELLSSYRTNVLRAPYLQTRSTQVSEVFLYTHLCSEYVGNVVLI